MPANFAVFVSTHQWIIILAAVWTIPWKGVALWKAARNKSLAWFVILLIINTVGILEIIYISFFSRKKDVLEESAAEEIKAPEKIVLDIKKEEETEEKSEETKADLDDSTPKS